MEILELYNDKFKKTGETIVRGEMPSKGKNIMLSVIFIKDENNKYLIQKTSKEKGNKFSSTGGHVIKGENALETIIRELEEELGICTDEEKINYITTFKHPTKNCIFNVYLLVIQNDSVKNIKLQKEEVEEVNFYDIKEIEKIIEKGDFLESHAYIFENYIK